MAVTAPELGPVSCPCGGLTVIVGGYGFGYVCPRCRVTVVQNPAPPDYWRKWTMAV